MAAEPPPSPEEQRVPAAPWDLQPRFLVPGREVPQLPAAKTSGRCSLVRQRAAGSGDLLSERTRAWPYLRMNSLAPSARLGQLLQELQGHTGRR